ncbi:hypothetical protein F7725_020434 [Dissostichus mawsoni]|uniref:Uncharacterized protein n=1 Tax=Dissostichus mawsoni TaxID=36200 RepID=A0A7J5YD69_DISMA|nr:hypothetical protein F7725_020434 [Dissostichus mawsoni]
MSIRYSSGRNKREREREKKVRRELEREAEKVDEEIGRDLGNYTRLKEELGEIERGKCMGAIIRSRAEYLVEGEKCTGFFLGMEKRKQVKNYIKQIEGEMITELVGIARIKDREGRDIQYERITESIRKTLTFWKRRKLKLRGKIIVVNGLIMSKLIYVLNVLDVPERVLKEIDKIIRVKIAKEVLENGYKDGGLKLINLDRKRKASRIKMMIRHLSVKNDHLWKVFLGDALSKCGGCGDSVIFMKMGKGRMNGMSEFQKEVLSAWGEFLVNVGYECVNVRQVWQQPIFLNPRIRGEKGSLFNLPMWRVGFRLVKDLVYEYVPGFMRSQVIVDEVRERDLVMGLRTADNVMESIKEGMPDEWRRMIEGEQVGRDESGVELYVGTGEKGSPWGK